MTYRDFRIGGDELQGISNCPHCGISSPLLLKVWASQKKIPRGDGGPTSIWAVHRCTTCGHLITARGEAGALVDNPVIAAVYPEVWEPSALVPEKVRSYLAQAHRTLSAPDASVVMSSSSIDAMLKNEGLTTGSLYERIDEAVASGLLTSSMAQWAHRVRLDANNPRHVDEAKPNMSPEDALRAFDFAKALTEYLYILPSRMPPEE
jgi:hypothetical protein